MPSQGVLCTTKKIFQFTIIYVSIPSQGELCSAKKILQFSIIYVSMPSQGELCSAKKYYNLQLYMYLCLHKVNYVLQKKLFNLRIIYLSASENIVETEVVTCIQVCFPFPTMFSIPLRKKKKKTPVFLSSISMSIF